MTDLERQGLSKSAEQYGATESNPKKGLDEVPEKLPLFLGQWEVAPDLLYRIGVTAFVSWFLLFRIADIFYIATVDARFPEGLGHLYPSEAQRLESVSYTRQVLFCGMVNRCLIFALVSTLLYFQLFARFDAGLRSSLAAIPVWWESSTIRSGGAACWEPIGRLVCAPIGHLLWYIFGRPCTWCGNFKDHCWNGRLSTDLSNRFGFPLTVRELLFGALYLTLLGAVFYCISAPFMYWRQWIDLKYGFANSLSVSLTGFRANFIGGLISMLITGIPQKFLFLAVLQYRLGWVFMWAGLIIAVIYAQHNVSMIAPMLGLNTEFPTSSFAVGRGFPLVETSNKQAPWISLNRLFWPDKFQQHLGNAEPNTFYTDDKSKGQLALNRKPNGLWAISGTAWFDPTASTYAQSQEGGSLSETSWNIGDKTGTHIGLRSGKELRDKLFGFASDRKIGIGNIYMVDGSHKDARANAFVTGAGNHSIIGLYDTLFLGSRGKEATEDDEVEEVTSSDSLVQHLGEVMQGADVESEDQDHKAPRSSAPSQAMNDDEIVAILAHELAHSALKHMEMGMGVQVLTTFITFASMGWMAHSPLAAAALSLSAPLIHVGSCAYDHVVSPPLEGFMKLFTDGLTRHNEYEADAYAALISEKYGTGLQTALAKLSVNSNQDPNPPNFWEALHADHPSFANRWAHIEKTKKKAYGNKKAVAR